MFTRQDYLQKACTHREYYAQYVTPRIKQLVEQNIGIEKLVNSTDQHLNDIRLSVWDILGYRAVTSGMKEQFRNNGDYVTPAGIVCLLKEAAKQLIEEHKNAN